MDGSYQKDVPLTTIDENTIPHTDLTVYTDPRLDVSTGRFNTPFLDWSIPTTIDGWIREITNGGPYLNKKNQPKKADQGSLSVPTETSSSAKNFHLARYADILLWYAEALIETGNPQGAREYVNQVRARAANGYVKAADPTTMLETPLLMYWMIRLMVNKIQCRRKLSYRSISRISIRYERESHPSITLGT